MPITTVINQRHFNLPPSYWKHKMPHYMDKFSMNVTLFIPFHVACWDKFKKIIKTNTLFYMFEIHNLLRMSAGWSASKNSVVVI